MSENEVNLKLLESITGSEVFKQKYLRDIAEQEVINRFTTAEITINQSNENHITNGMDLDGVISALCDGVSEAIEVAAEGIHE